MSLIYQHKVDTSFVTKVNEVSNRLNINPNWLMAVIHFESAGSFSPSITNSLGYVGLIQFGEMAANRIGTTRDQLKKMSAVEQLEYVYKYYKPYKSKIKGFIDLYLATLFPVAIGKNSNYVLHTSRLSPEKIAKANPIFDLNKDLKITIGEIEKKMLSRYPKEWRDILKKKE